MEAEFRELFYSPFLVWRAGKLYVIIYTPNDLKCKLFSPFDSPSAGLFLNYSHLQAINWHKCGVAVMENASYRKLCWALMELRQLVYIHIAFP